MINARRSSSKISAPQLAEVGRQTISLGGEAKHRIDHSWAKKLFVAFLLVTPLFLSSYGHALNLHVSPQPQVNNKTCQSYMAAFALAALDDPSFPIKNFSQLREFELKFRMALGKLGSTTKHTNWSKAMEAATGSVYTFDLSYSSNNVVDWYKKVKSYVSISPSIDLLMNEMNGGSMDVVLTSVKGLAGNDYSRSGHIVAVLGLEGSGLDSSTKAVFFNSAIKNGDRTGHMCTADNYPGDETYSAGLMTTNDFILKSFDEPNERYLVMRLVRK